MAQSGVKLDRETFSCSICLELLKDPVSLTCGHSYCMNCIQALVLMKNTMLADLVEELKKSSHRAAPPEHCYAGPEDVACDSCTGRKLKALKSCLFCLASYCEQHLQPHHESPAFQKHKLVEPSKKLQENICPRHNEVLKIFCRTDQKCICHLCAMDEHKGHDTVTAAAERTNKQKELDVSREKIHQGIQDRERDVKVLQHEVEAINGSADRAVQHSEETFAEMIRLLQKKSSEVKQQLRFKQETEVRRVKEFQQKLEQEISDLKRKDAELKQLSHTEDHNQFLQNYPSLSTLSDYTHSSSINICPMLTYFEDVTEDMSEVRDKLQDVLTEICTNITRRVTQVDILSSQLIPKTRDEFLKYACEITLDPNTVNTQLRLSHWNRKVKTAIEVQSYPSHPDRFTVSCQALSAESLTGRCYWEVERSGRVDIAVAYKDISRAGCSNECRFGCNDKSWALHCDEDHYIFRSNNVLSPPE